MTGGSVCEITRSCTIERDNKALSQLFSTEGAFQGVRSRTVMLPGSEVCFSVLTNASDGPAETWAEGIVRILKTFRDNPLPGSSTNSWTGRWWNSGEAVDLVPLWQPRPRGAAGPSRSIQGRRRDHRNRRAPGNHQPFRRLWDSRRARKTGMRPRWQGEGGLVWRFSLGQRTPSPGRTETEVHRPSRETTAFVLIARSSGDKGRIRAGAPTEHESVDCPLLVPHSPGFTCHRRLIGG